MDDFTRVSWVSENARLIWQKSIAQASEAWLDLELQSVLDGVRANALVFGRERVLGSHLPFSEVYENRYAVGRQHQKLADAFAARDDMMVGALLGFPPCCQNFFTRVWGGGGLDTTWEMSCKDALDFDTVHPVTGPIECNILGRWLGIRWVTHLPCSFNCDETRVLGHRMQHLMTRRNPGAANTINAVLSWPVEWSALHGVAEIKYPVCKVSTRTTYTTTKQVVRRSGVVYPAEGATGVVFPYQKTKPIAMVFRRNGPSFSDNGFTSKEAMDTAHQMVLDVLGRSMERGIILDLGAGNGALIDRARLLYERTVMGIECVADKCRFHPDITVGDLRDVAKFVSTTVGTILVSQRRFDEIPSLQAWCREHAAETILYSYDEPTFARFL